MLTVTERWDRVCEGQGKANLETVLPNVLRARRWFGGKARVIQSVRIVEVVPIPARSTSTKLLFIRVEYREGNPETYTLPVTAAFGEEAAQIQRDLPQAVVAPLKVQVKDREQTGVVYDALWNADLSRALLDAIGQGCSFKGTEGTLIASSTKAYSDLVNAVADLDPAVMKAEQSNTSVVYGDRVILKLYRRLENGVNPDWEIGRVLTAMTFPYSPPVGGAIEYVRSDGEPVTLAILQAFVRNQGDAWKHTLEAFDRYLRQSRAQTTALDGTPAPRKPLMEMVHEEVPALAHELIGLYLESAESLGQRTAELHVALAQCRDNQNFAPEPFSSEYRRSRYESMCQLAERTCSLLKLRLNDLPSTTKQEARRVLDYEPGILARFRALLDLESSALRIRCHGDYHLGQVLWTGQNFMIIDFEGEPARPLSERRIKHPPILDVVGMLRSFHYAPYAVLLDQRSDPLAEDDLETLEPWIRFWYSWVSAVFLKAYLGIAGRASFWPQSRDEVEILLDVHLLEKAVYELGYELNNRPDWVKIPLRGIIQLLDRARDAI